MDNNYPNIFGNPKSTHGVYTCGICFQEFVHYNDMVIHERMHLEQMSLASLQTHLLPQFDNRATVLTSNLQANLRPQIDNRTLGIATTVQPVASPLAEKGLSTVCTTGQSSARPQDIVNRTSVFDNPVSYTKAVDSLITEQQIPRTHTELKTPTYTLITSYDRDLQQVKRPERSRSQDDSKISLYDTEAVLEKVTHGSSDVSSLGRPHDNKSPLYEVIQNSLEKNVIPARSDINVVGISQIDPRTSLYDLTTLEKTIQLAHFENPLQKPQIETITLYPENLHVEGYGKRQTLATPTVIQASVTDYSRQTLSRHNDYPISNIQYQIPVSAVRQTATPQYSAERQQPTPVQVIEMPLSAEYHKKPTEITTVVPTISQSAYSNITSYVPATLSYTPLNPISSSLFRPDQLQSAPPVYQRFDTHHQVVQGQLEKFYPENYSHNQYEVHAGPVSSNIATPVQSPQTVYFTESNTTISSTNNDTKPSTANTTIPSTTAVSAPVVFTSSFPAKKQLPAVMLSDGTFYPSGLPLPETSANAEAGDTSSEKNEPVPPDTVKPLESTASMVETDENEKELHKKQEFVDMIKMMQGERKMYKKRRYISESSDGENNESSYEYKVDIACFICSEEFEKEKKLFKHLHKHRKSGELSPLEESDDDDGERKKKKLCKYCGKQFMRLHQLIEHIRRHTAEKAYECRFCDRGYVIKQRCLKHEATHNKEETGIHCEICDTELEDKAQYLFHVHGHALSKDKQEAEEKQQEFADMIRSMQSDKSTEKEKVDDAEHQMLNLLLDFEKEKVKCKTSNEQAEKEILETVVCRICPEIVSKKDFLEHFKSHKIYTCHTCGRGFTRKLNYTYHSDTLHLKAENNEQITVKKTFLCSICERKFSKKSKLKHHLESHVSDEPLVKCDVCEKPFYNKGDYLFHLNKHDVGDMAKLEEKEKRKKQHLESKPKKGLKIKISSTKVPKKDRFTRKSEGPDISHEEDLTLSRELRNRGKRKTTDYSWQGLVEENLKAGSRDRSKRKSGHNDSPEEKHSKRIKKQVDRYSETLNEDFAHLRNLRKRKHVNYEYTDADDERGDERDDECDIQKEEFIVHEKDAIEQASEAVQQKLPDSLNCKVCKKQIPKLEFIAHFKNHCLLSCEECERSFTRKNTYISHLKNVHQKEITEEFLEKEFSKFSEYKLQKQREKNEEKQISAKLKESEVTEINKQTLKSAKVKGDKVKEVKKQKSPKLKQSTETKQNEKEQDSCRYEFKNDTENPFICILCQKRFNKKSSVVNHVKIHFNIDMSKTEISSPCPSLNKNAQSPKKSKEISVQNESEKPVKEQTETKPKIKSYFCGICKRTITRRQNFETHMKAKHSNEAQESKQVDNYQTKTVSSEPKLKLGIDVRSPPKKRKIFMDDVLEDRTGISVVNSLSNITSGTNLKNEVKSFNSEKETKAMSENKFSTAAQTNDHSGNVQPNSGKHTKGRIEHIDKSELDQLVSQSKEMVIVGKPGKSYPKFCPVCHQEQKSLRNYTEHLRIHTGDKPFKCDVCQNQFRRERNCKAHMKKCHPNKCENLSFESKELKDGALESNCKTKKMKQKDLGLNLESKDDALETAVGMRSRTCKQVNVLDISAKDYELGIADITGLNSSFGSSNEPDEPRALDLSMKEVDLSIDSPGNSQRNTPVKSPKAVGINNTAFKKCPICFMKIYSKETFDVHLSSHSESKPFSCKFCHMCFEEKRQLYDHRKTHPIEKPGANTSTDYSSEDSAIDTVTKHGKASGQRHVAKTKMDYSDEDNPLDLICKLCYANFMTKTAFDTHLQLHAEEENEEEERESDQENSSDLNNISETTENSMSDKSEHTDDNMLDDRSEYLDDKTKCRSVSLSSDDKLQQSKSKLSSSNACTNIGSASAQCSNQQNAVLDSIKNVCFDEQKKLDKPVSETISGCANNENDLNVSINKNLAQIIASDEHQTKEANKQRLGESHNLNIISGDYVAQDSIEASKTRANFAESSIPESASFEDTYREIKCLKSHEKTMFVPNMGYSVDDRCAGNCERSVYTEACLHSNIRSHAKKSATFESDKNLRMGDGVYLESDLARIQEDSNDCVNCPWNVQKDLVPVQMYANYNNRNDMYRNTCNLPVQNHLTVTSRINSKTPASAEVLSDKEVELSRHEYWHEKETGMSKTLQSQSVTKLSPETALTKWKQKVESVMISQLELNEKRKFSCQNRVDNSSSLGRADNQFIVEGISGDLNKYECRLCSDVINNREEFIEHIDVHMNESPPYCELCDIYFMAIYPKRRLIEHNRKKHSDLIVSEDF